MRRLFPIFLLVSAMEAWAQVPALLTFQGRVSVGANNFNGVGQFKFALVSQDALSTFWRNAADANADGEPDSAVALNVSNGLYSVALGDTSLANMGAIPPQVFGNAGVHLRVWFNDGAHGFQLLSPDQRVTAAGYAMMAANVPDASVTLAKLAPDAAAAIANSQSGAIAALNSSVASLNTKFDGLNSSVLSLQSSVSTLNASVAGINTTLSSHGSQIASLNNSVSTLSASVSALNSTVGGHTTQLNSLSADVNDLKTSVNSINTSLVGVNSQLAQQAGQIANLASQLPVGAPVGATFASNDGADASLTSQGYVRFASIPAPAWTTGSIDNMPGARDQHSAVWTGDRMVIWGGNGNGGVTQTGGYYEPELDHWTTVSPIGAPSARAGHTAIWTGSSMIVWGGHGAAYEKSGGIYTPSPQGWIDTALDHAPDERESHVAVWTGARMIVWGGQNDALVSSAGLYDPVQNKWTDLSLAGAPDLRIEATAVWAGDRMVVWGGHGITGGSVAYLNNGGRLLFTGGATPVQWLPITLSGAPSGRVGHSAIWTGSRMIVWGGRTGSTYLNDGASYDPIADSWTPIAPGGGTPTARSGHCTIWTGVEMLIIGGETTSGAFASGAAYNPSTGKWRSLTGAGSPIARAGSTAIWSGAQAIVFGGHTGGAFSTPLAALQSLDPQPTWHLYRKP